MMPRAACGDCPLRALKTVSPPALPDARAYIVTTRATRYGVSYTLLHIDEVVSVRSEAKTTVITTRYDPGKTWFTQASVNAMVAAFSQLLMVTRGLAVHYRAIVALTYGARGDARIQLHGQTDSLPVSRRYLSRVRALFRDRPGRLPSRWARGLAKIPPPPRAPPAITQRGAIP